MANRRMFARSITKTGKFLKMPQSTRLLYYDLGMEADDDGVVEAFAVMRTTGASEDDLRVLVAKEYITILNDDLLAYINDWNINNFIRSDRYTPSIHQEELKALEIPVKFTIPENVKKGNSDVGIPDGIPPVDPGKVRLGKDRLDKDKDTNKASKADLESEFEELWKIYPRKEGKKKALASYIRVRKKGTTFEEVKAGIDAYNAYLIRTRRSREYTKTGGVWFNGHCWEDDYETGATASRVSSEEAEALNEIFG